MSDVGHLYVLANSAMPGLVKIGKTTRSPSERAAELSSVTGLPTAFIVVYEQLFENCSEAELFVHTYLASKGHRVSDGREFFNAPVNSVIRAIALAPGPLDPETLDTGISARDGGSQMNRSDSEAPAWTQVFESALCHYRGDGDVLQDFAIALTLFGQAARLGSIEAYGKIGDMYFGGEGVQSNASDALRHYQQGAQKGDVYCHWRMGMLFWAPEGKSKRHTENAEKCFAVVVIRVTEALDVNGSNNAVNEQQWPLIIGQMLTCLVFANMNDDVEQLPKSLVKLISLCREYVVVVGQGAIGGLKGSKNSQLRALYQKVLKPLRY